MTRRVWVACGFGTLVLALLAAGCAPRGVVKRHEVVFWVAWPVPAIEPLARRFEAENPDVEVHLVALPWESGADSVAAAIEAGSPPDLCQLHSTQLAPFMAGSSLSDWSAGVADLRAGLRGWEMCMVGDAIYGLPWLLRTRALYFNKALFVRAEIDAVQGPETWDELRGAAARIQHLRGGVHGIGLPALAPGEPFETFMPFAWGHGGELPSADRDTSRFDCRANLDALWFLFSLRVVGLTASADSLAREFVSGRLGLVFAGSELGVRLAREAPRLRYGVAPVPRPDDSLGTHAALAGGEVLVSFTDSRRKEDALKLARFLVRPENAHALATALQTVQPAYLGADTTAWYLARPEQQIMFRQYETARYLPSPRNWAAIEDTIRVLLADAMVGRRRPEQALALADTFITMHMGQR